MQVFLLVLGVALVSWNKAAGLFLGLVFLAPIIIAIDLGRSRDRTGWMWGLLLGWLGVLILACMRAQPRQSLDA